MQVCLPFLCVWIRLIVRRGMVDMRKRFRGNAPVGVRDGGKPPQLYGGKPMHTNPGEDEKVEK